MTLTEHDPARLREVFAAYPTGVTAVAAELDGRPTGIAANSFVSVSLVPALVSFCVAHTSKTWPGLRTSQRLGINVLGAHQEIAARQLAGPAEHRFDDVEWQRAQGGAVRLTGASAWLECAIEQEVTAGDHDIVVLAVLDLELDPEVPPLVFHGSRFRELGR